MTSDETRQEVPLLQYSQGYWTGSDGQFQTTMPHALMWKHYQAELRERGIAKITVQDAGRRAEAFHECRKLSYWSMVDDPQLIRTTQAQEDRPNAPGS